MKEDSSQADALRRVSSGLVGLDLILGGGFMQGGLYIIQGIPGAGKTILANQICFNHVAGAGRALFVTLLAENHARMVGNLRPLEFFDEKVIPDRLTYLSAFTELHEHGLDGLVRLLRREIQERRATMLIVDGLLSARTCAPDEATFKAFIHELQEIAYATECTMFLTTNGTSIASPEHTIVDGLIELSERMLGWQAHSDLQVRKFRGAGFLRGRHSYKITNAGFVVHPRIEALPTGHIGESEATNGRISIGIEHLNALLCGGLPAASTTMILGPSGVGKTTLGLQFLAESSKSEPGLMFSFYETPSRLKYKAENVCPGLCQLLDRGTVEVLWQTSAHDLLDAYGERLLEAVRRRHVKRLFIDGLSAFKNAAVEPSRINDFFTALGNELRVLGVTTLYTLETPQVLGPVAQIPVGDVSSLAENLIQLRFVELRSRLFRMLSILKVRDSDFDSSLYEFVLTRRGFGVQQTPATAEVILSGQFPADVAGPAALELRD